ncbi:hypothetical protein Fmac_024350 [Flemingia macrophylla]|uniref:CHHC U11-48K-type domain-containing protein n=1 Tax=Flemingia macrophylla TaxID=520843 RepID=A0ABD1LP57_9FABA
MNSCGSSSLSWTVASLNNLIALSNDVLSLYPSPPTTPNGNLIQCLFNPHHRLPPHSLFRHHLRCPSAPRRLPLPDLTPSLTYPQTLLNAPSDQPSFYLNSNFFYRHCPAVVAFSPALPLTTLSLPSFLSLSLQCQRTQTLSPLLPSHYFSVSRELDHWSVTDFPASFSHSVLRAVSALATADERHFADWIIANSPRYGVVIDAALQHHIFRLCCVCLNSIINEASVRNRDSPVDCPVSYQALTWLASQVSILYGAGNGRAFVLDFVKKCIMVGASVLLLFPLGSGEGASDPSAGCGETKDCLLNRTISVSQVAAAVAALHERSLFEQKIKGFWFSQQPSNYQLAAEHSYLSEKANEERAKRPDYRPLIDHDGLHRQQSSNQETSKKKTREELLAEERDYKRRRMSYRGKKANKSQSPLQVMRYMIEDFMEQIKQAGGFESPAKMSEESGLFPRKPPALDIPVEANNSKKVSLDSHEVGISNTHYCETQSHTNCSDKSKTVVDDALSRDYKEHKHEHWRSHYYREDQRSAERGKHHRDRPSTSPERRPSHGRSQEHISHHNKQGYYSNRKKYDNSSRIRDRWQKDTHRSQNSDSSMKNAFSDRYQPSESLDICEDISDAKCIKSDKFNDKESY